MHQKPVSNRFTNEAQRDPKTLEGRISEILHEDEDTWTLLITKLYRSKMCCFIYIFMALLCLFLVIWSMFMGKEWSKNWLFILFECVVNAFVVLDIVFKLKLLVSVI